MADATICIDRRGDEWAVLEDDHGAGTSKELARTPGRGEAVERALLECRTRGLELAGPVAPGPDGGDEPGPLAPKSVST